MFLAVSQAGPGPPTHIPIPPLFSLHWLVTSHPLFLCSSRCHCALISRCSIHHQSLHIYTTLTDHGAPLGWPQLQSADNFSYTRDFIEGNLPPRVISPTARNASK